MKTNDADLPTADRNTTPLSGTAHVARSPGANPHPGARKLPSQRQVDLQPAWANQFLPTLFDRLCDDAPHQHKESSRDYAPTRSQLRKIVQRDLTFLLNTINQADLLHPERHREVLSSTVNYGVPALAGSYLSDRKWSVMETIIRNAILNYEPRLLPDTVVIRPLMKDDSKANYNVLLFEIQGTLYMEPYPVEFTVQSSVDLESGHMALS